MLAMHLANGHHETQTLKLFTSMSTFVTGIATALRHASFFRALRKHSYRIELYYTLFFLLLINDFNNIS